MVENQTISIFIPLLFLVIMELAGLAREMDLSNVVERDYRPFLLGFWPGFSQALNEHLSIPRLGRFNFIHGANFVLLSIGMVLVRQLASGWVQLALGFITWVLWVLLPVLEVDEYDDVLREERPWSFLLHAVLSTITAIFVVFSPEFVDVLGASDVPVFSEEPDDWGLWAYMMLALVSNHQFLISLERELAN